MSVVQAIFMCLGWHYLTIRVLDAPSILTVSLIVVYFILMWIKIEFMFS